jgi:hypothetical protein
MKHVTNLPATLLRPVFLLSGLCALACIPGILAAERFGWSERPFHAAQFLSALVCFVGSLGYLLMARHRTDTPLRVLAVTAAVLSGSYLAFLAWVIARIDFSGM